MLREVKVGLLMLAAVAVFIAGVFLIGDRQQLFASKVHYSIEFAQTGGLARGASVQLSGVDVGQVKDVVLPEDVTEEKITVEIFIDRRYQQRIREDSLARIKTLGLLGDKFIEISSGSPDSPQIRGGGQIPAASATDVDQLIATGEDVAENVVAMSASLRNILARLERGEGIFGELTAGGEEGEENRASLRSTLNSIESLLVKIDSGQGTIGQLFNDPTLANRVESAVARLEQTVEAFESGEGVLPSLLHDPQTRERFDRIMANLDQTTGEFGGLVSELREGEGLLIKLMTDNEYSDRVSADLELLIDNLNQVAEKINSGDGTVASLVNDPVVFEALNDILIGVDESKFLSWLVRNRQKKGIEERYEGEVERMEAEGLTPPPLEPTDGAGEAP
jgi:phospholipid/cholesterol/gamma-HCH transport system substrate-binding protein